MPNPLISASCVRFLIVAVRTVPAATFATITPFKMILFGKNFVSVLREVKIPFLQWYKFLHCCKFMGFIPNI
jgi:hypothetical protein